MPDYPLMNQALYEGRAPQIKKWRNRRWPRAAVRKKYFKKG